MFQHALTLDYFVDIDFPQSPEPKYEHMKSHIEHIEFIIDQAKSQILDFKRMTHQVKMEIIALREKIFFEAIDIPQDSRLLITNFQKHCRGLANANENEINKNFKEMQSVVRDKEYLQEQIILANDRLEKLEETTGTYGLYYRALLQDK